MWDDLSVRFITMFIFELPIFLDEKDKIHSYFPKFSPAALLLIADDLKAHPLLFLQSEVSMGNIVLLKSKCFS